MSVPARRWRGPVTIAIAVVAVAAVAVLANLTLLDSAGEERLGKLRQSDPTLTTPASRADGGTTTAGRAMTTTAGAGAAGAARAAAATTTEAVFRGGVAPVTAV